MNKRMTLVEVGFSKMGEMLFLTNISRK